MKSKKSNEKIKPNTFSEELNALRTVINDLDQHIIELISQRLQIVRHIGVIKKQQKVKIRDPKREKQLQQFYKKLSKKHKITYPTIQKIFLLLMEESRRLQK